MVLRCLVEHSHARVACLNAYIKTPPSGLGLSGACVLTRCQRVSEIPPHVSHFPLRPLSYSDQRPKRKLNDRGGSLIYFADSKFLLVLTSNLVFFTTYSSFPPPRISRNETRLPSPTSSTPVTLAFVFASHSTAHSEAPTVLIRIAGPLRPTPLVVSSHPQTRCRRRDVDHKRLAGSQRSNPMRRMWTRPRRAPRSDEERCVCVSFRDFRSHRHAPASTSHVLTAL